MTFEQALDHSFERLTLMVKAKRQRRIRETLDLAHLIAAGWGDADAWREKQQQLLDELNDE